MGERQAKVLDTTLEDKDLLLVLWWPEDGCLGPRAWSSGKVHLKISMAT